MVVPVVVSMALELASGFLVTGRVCACPAVPAFAAHWAACALFAWNAVRLISGRCGLRCGGETVLFFAFSFFVPVLGMLGLCSVMPAFWNGLRGKAAVAGGYASADARLLPEALPQRQDGPGPANPGLLVSALRHSPDSSRRNAAILATLRLPDQDAVNILRVALGDPEDDIRLLAYALLAQMDKRHNDDIQACVQQLRSLPSEQRFRVNKHIAQQYWELAWVGLARGESVAPILRRALENVEAGLAAGPMDAGLLLLQGKILLRLKRYDEAFDALSSAEMAGMDRIDMAPYLAEVSFFRRQLSGVVGHMESARLDLRSSLAMGVRAYWGESRYAS